VVHERSRSSMRKPAMATGLLPSLMILLAMSVVRGGGAAAAGGSPSWCICKPNASAAALQRALDYACGHGADCGALRTGGQCQDPDTLLAHCSYAANSYFLSNGAATCDFDGAATVSFTDPSTSCCSTCLDPTIDNSRSLISRTRS
jgi:hypothetical protein